MLIIRNSVFFIYVTCLVGIWLFGLFFTLYKWPQEKAAFHDASLRNSLYYITQSGSDDKLVTKDIVLGLLDQSVDAVALNPYDRLAWVRVAALLSAARERGYLDDPDVVINMDAKALRIAKLLDASNADITDAVYENLLNTLMPALSVSGASSEDTP